MSIYNTNSILDKSFYSKQINDIKKKGPKILFFKLKILTKLALVAIPSVIIVFLIRVLSPLVIIKLIPLDMGRIGNNHLVWFFKLKNVGEIKFRRTIYFFYFNNSTDHTNFQWLKMWKEHIKIFPSFIFKYVLIINKFFPGYEKHELPIVVMSLSNPRQAKEFPYLHMINKSSIDKLIKHQKPLIKFTNEDITIGKSYLKKIGTSEDNFVCFHSRDSSFLTKYNRDIDWSYHNYRDFNIYSYLPAMEKMTKKSFFCFRMGVEVENKLTNSNSKIIDYANSQDRSDLLDIFLSSRCRFFLCSQTGLATLPETFNRPTVYVNGANIAGNNTFANNSLFIPKKHYSSKKQRFLTFKEIINLENQYNLSRKEMYDQLGIKLIDNTSEEIMDVVVEMEARLAGTWVSDDDEEEDLQEKFWDLFDWTFIKSPTYRFGSKFLKQNKDLLL